MTDVTSTITTLTLERPMCVPCVASEAATESAIALIKSALVLRRDIGSCRACGATGVAVISVSRPA